jgi:hypothetical protein
MADILVYALHYEGAFNKNSLGAISEAAKLAAEIGGEAHVLVLGSKEELTDELCGTLGTYGATKVYRAEGPEGSLSPWSTPWRASSGATATATRCSAAACSASRSGPASSPASTPA